MSVIAHRTPSQAMIDAATGHVEAARRTNMHASHHARAALEDAIATDDQLQGAVDALDRVAKWCRDGEHPDKIAWEAERAARCARGGQS